MVSLHFSNTSRVVFSQYSIFGNRISYLQLCIICYAAKTTGAKENGNGLQNLFMFRFCKFLNLFQGLLQGLNVTIGGLGRLLGPICMRYFTLSSKIIAFCNFLRFQSCFHEIWTKVGLVHSNRISI